jgi:hypothetical protein
LAGRTIKKNRSGQPVPDHIADQTHRHQDEPRSRPWLALACGGGALWLFFTIYLLRLDQVVGMVVDDAWYILLGKALATGEGYQMINAPTPGIRPIVPPVFPALLAIFWRLWPDFPDNLWLFKAVSIAAMLGVGLVAFVYFRRDRELPLYLALGIAAATVFYPPLVLHATSMVMAECVFMLVQLAAIVVIERGVGRKGTKAAWRYAALSGTLAALAYLTRSVGAGLLAASVLYPLKERCPRQALIVGFIVAISAGSWIGYSRMRAPTPEQRLEQAGSIVEPYDEQFWQRLAGNPSAGSIKASELPGRVWKNLSEIGKFDLGAVPLYAFYRSIVPGQQILLSQLAIWFSLALAALAIIGFIAVSRERMTLAEFTVPLSLAISVLWSWEQFRFLLPLIPLLIFYQLMGLRAVFRLCQRLYAKPKPQVMWTTLTIIVWLMAALNVYANFGFIQKQYDPGVRMQWHSDFEENTTLLRQVSEKLPPEAVLATQNPALVHLFTGHKTVALGDPASSWEMWKRLGVRYLVYASPNPLPPFEPVENSYPTIYRQGGRLNLRVVDLGPPSSRPAWGR